MKNKKVNTTIESEAIETAASRTFRKVIDKLLTILIVIMTLVLLLTFVSCIEELNDDKVYRTPEEPDHILRSLNSHYDYSYMISDVHKARVSDCPQSKYALCYAVVDYQEASILECAYRYAGDFSKASYYENIKKDSRERMVDPKTKKALTYYADTIDKKIQKYKEALE